MTRAAAMAAGADDHVTAEDAGDTSAGSGGAEAAAIGSDGAPPAWVRSGDEGKDVCGTALAAGMTPWASSSACSSSSSSSR